MRLFLLLERGLPPHDANAAMVEAARHKDQFTWLERPASFGRITVADVRACTSAESHAATVRAWAHDAWQAWGPHHSRVREWAGCGVEARK